MRTIDVSLLVCTHGTPEWKRRGSTALERTLRNLASDYVQPAEALAVHRKTGTISGVRNEAAAAATCEWLCFLDGDDELAAGYFDAMDSQLGVELERKLPNRMPYRPWRLLVPAVEYVGAHGQQLTRPEIPNWGRRLIEINCAVIGTLVPRALFHEVGGFRDRPSIEDWELMLKCFIAGASFVPVPDAVYRAERRQGSRNADQSVYWQLRAEHEHAYLVEEHRRQSEGRYREHPLC